MTSLTSLDWFPVVRQGDDLVVPRAVATWFGGDSDPEDNGQTASGVPTKGHPTLLGCALPLAGYGLKSLRGTPLPRMAFGLHHDGSPNPDGAWVEVTCGLHTLNLPVIDLGPSLRTRHAIDLTVAAFKYFAGDLSSGVITVSYRLKRGALFLPKETGNGGVGDAGSGGNGDAENGRPLAVSPNPAPPHSLKGRDAGNGGKSETGNGRPFPVSPRPPLPHSSKGAAS